MKHHAHMIRMNPLGNVISRSQRVRVKRRQAAYRACVANAPHIAPVKPRDWLQRTSGFVILALAALFRRRGRS